jgi:hypothetical protein
MAVLRVNYGHDYFYLQLITNDNAVNAKFGLGASFEGCSALAMLIIHVNECLCAGLVSIARYKVLINHL